VLPLLQQRPAQLLVANRTPQRAAELAHRFAAQGPVAAAAFDQLGAEAPFDVIVNATSASLDAQLPALPPSVFGADSFCYDMMYGAAPTVFLRFAASHGAHTRDGLGMLVEQAAESFFVWRGVRPQTGPVLAELRARLASG
ncbi:MAG: shikimate dehydrogenase, partial [Burkholderiaceae bacterium]